MYHRTAKLSKSQSFFLFGARGTGKSELLKAHFKDNALFIDLLDPELSNKLSAYPNELLNIINPHKDKKAWVVIDEIQKVPQLLEIVHQEISKKSFKFALTGSSARKLKRGSANLLAGRAIVFNLFPLSHNELDQDFSLNEVLSLGSLPELFSLEEDLEKKRFLKAYSQVYLKEEIIEEQIVRNLPPFRRFLDIVGHHTTEIINFSNIARDIDSDPKTVQRYFEILEDTLLGFFLPSFNRSIRKQQKKSKKFYFFDTGVARVLAKKIDNKLVPKTFEYGQMFENFIVNEINKLLTYKEKQFDLSFLRISDTQEIDLIVEKHNGDIFLCEIKSTDKINQSHSKTLNNLSKDFPNSQAILISNDKTEKKYDNVIALHWEMAINKIVND